MHHNNWQSYKDAIIATGENVIHSHSREEKSELFISTCSSDTEIDYLDLIFGIVRAKKPVSILETGTHFGQSTIAIAYAAKENHIQSMQSMRKPKVCTLEHNLQHSKIASLNIHAEGLSEYIDVLVGDSIEIINKLGVTFDFVFFDSSRKVRFSEYSLLKDKKLIEKGTILVFHDTSVLRGISKPDNGIQKCYLESLKTLESECSEYIDFPLSRGLKIFVI